MTIFRKRAEIIAPRMIVPSAWRTGEDREMKHEHHIRPEELWAETVLISSVLLMLISLFFALWQALLQSG